METLPNELLLECFKYLDGLHIFHSFDELNQRFSILIRSIPLFIGFENMTTEYYYRSALTIFSNRNITKQIHSLNITSQNPFQKRILESKFLIDGFIHLQSLTLDDIDESLIEKFIQIFSKLPQLHTLHINKLLSNIDKLLPELPISQLRTLTLPGLYCFENFLEKLSLIENLKIFLCTVSTLHDLFNFTTNLKHLHINYLQMSERIYIPTEHQTSSIHLKSLILENFNHNFEQIEYLLKRMPDLKVLQLTNYQDHNSFTIDQWQNLISNTLTKLKHFHLTSRYAFYVEHDDIKKTYEQLQTNYWLNEHQWYSECILSKVFSTIYTIPYQHNSYTLSSSSETYFNQTINRQNIFANVKDVQLDVNLIANQCPCYFPYITSIGLGQCCLNKNYFRSLKSIVNLTNINQLRLAVSCNLKNSSVLFDILNQSSNISSLHIVGERLLPLLFDNKQLCDYLSKKIKKLTLLKEDTYEIYTNLFQSWEKPNYIDNSIEDFYQINKFWQIFENLEQLECTIEKRQSIQFLIENLPKLINLNIHSTILDLKTQVLPLAIKIAANLGIELVHKIISNDLFIWIIREGHYELQ